MFNAKRLLASSLGLNKRNLDFCFYILIQFYQTQAYFIETYEYFPKQ